MNDSDENTIFISGIAIGLICGVFLVSVILLVKWIVA